MGAARRSHLSGDYGVQDIRINDQWRICFVWRDSEAHDAEFTDYH
jgi:proteic killer suppression protein